jgi:DedD protein
MPTDNVNEQEIQFKKRARRRLVGAVALVLLMITVLPMILDDHASKAPQQEIAITIPSQDGEFTSKIVPIPPQTAAGVSASPNHQEIIETPVEQQPIPANSETINPDLTSKTEVAKTEMDSPVSLTTSSTTTPTKPDPEVTKVQPVKEAVKKEMVAKTAPVKALQEKMIPAKSTEDKALKASSIEKPGTFSLQIGVFSDAANVKQLQQKLTTQNLKSYTEKLPTASGDKIRLRAGPFATKVEADKAFNKAKEVGLVGMVVANK